MESVQRSNAYFICCLLPHHTAAIDKLLTSAVYNRSLNMQLLRRQLRGLQVLDALLIQKQGYYYSHDNIISYAAHTVFKRTAYLRLL